MSSTMISLLLLLSMALSSVQLCSGARHLFEGMEPTLSPSPAPSNSMINSPDPSPVEDLTVGKWIPMHPRFPKVFPQLPLPAHPAVPSLPTPGHSTGLPSPPQPFAPIPADAAKAVPPAPQSHE
uniref:Uncharacterized protein n=1 Tax=Anthurium amnicola TaxID=1678845 RepID=A0A1D1XK25_9ARAE